jgi:hypothetical protein
VNTAIPEAASGSQCSSHTRRDASTTSKGAARKPIPEGYGVLHGRSDLLDKRTTDDPVGFERVDLGAGEAEFREELGVVLTEQRGMPLVQPSGPA